MNQRELAQLLGICVPYVQAFEHDKRQPSESQLDQLVRILEIARPTLTA